MINFKRDYYVKLAEFEIEEMKEWVFYSGTKLKKHIDDKSCFDLEQNMVFVYTCISRSN